MLRVLAVAVMIIPLIQAERALADAPGMRYVDFPAAIDPHGTHKHVPLRNGSVLFGRPQLVVHQTSRDRQGRDVDDTYLIDADSQIVRYKHELLVVEPDGHRYHFSPHARIESNGESWSYVVIAPGQPIPPHLRSHKPDIDLR